MGTRKFGYPSWKRPSFLADPSVKLPISFIVEKEMYTFEDRSGDSLSLLEVIIQALDHGKVNYVLNSRLVRGLDYYSNTVFEWVTSELGAQGTVCAGGRYDGPIEQLGARSNYAIGFALGFERLNALVEAAQTLPPSAGTDIYFIRVGADAEPAALQLTEQLRETFPHLKLQMNCGGGSFKSQFKRADKSNARFALILGDDEVANNTIAIKPLREEIPQSTIDQSELADYLKNILNTHKPHEELPWKSIIPKKNNWKQSRNGGKTMPVLSSLA